MSAGEYILSEDEYEVVETGEPRPIESETVQRKLESPHDEIIEQDDFEDFYTVRDYFLPGEDTFPRDVSGNLAKIAGTTVYGGFYSAGAYALTDNPQIAIGALAAIPVGVYLEGLMDEDMELDTALRNTRSALEERIDF